MALTDKQKLFVQEYLACWNATAAALKAGYSEKTAYSIGHENLKKPEIANEIQARLSERVMSADEVLDRLSQQARFNFGKYLRVDGRIDISAVIADGNGHLIKALKERQFGTDIEFHSPFDALQLLGKHHKLFVERTETEHSGELLVRVKYEND